MMKNTLVIFLLFFTSVVIAQDADFKSYVSVNADADFFGVWMCVDTCSFDVLGDEGAPTVTWLVINESSSYFSSYLHPEFGAAIDIEFSYQREGGTFNSVFTASNSLGYFMEHENEKFTFQLFVDNQNEGALLLVNDHGSFELVPYEL